MNSSPSEPSSDGTPAPDEIAIGAGFDLADPKSPLAPYYLGLSHVLAVAILAAVFLLISFAPLWHTDIWGHLKFGQWIVEHGQWPVDDPFCPFAEKTGEMVYPGQVGERLLYGVFHLGQRAAGGDHLRQLAGGVDALRFFQALIVTLRLAVLLIAFRRVSGSLPIACAALAVLIVFSTGNILVFRPQILGELFFAVTMLALSRPLLDWKSLLALLAVFIAWPNLHGSFGTGLLLVACVLAGRALDILIAEKGKMSRLTADAQCRRLLGLLIAAVVGIGCLNPAGFAIFENVLKTAQHPVVRLQDEWTPLRFEWSGGGQWTFLAIAALLIATQACCRRWFSMESLILIVAFVVQPLRHQRMLIWWLMIAPWLMARYWPDCRLGWFAPFFQFHSTPSFRKSLLAGALIVIAALWSIPGRWIVSGTPGKLELTLTGGTCWQLAAVLDDPSATPAPSFQALAKAMHDRYPQGRFVGNIFASETQGDYLLWELSPRIPVFTYTHVHNFNLPHWNEHLAVRFAQKGWREILDRHQMNLVVVEPVNSAPLCERLRQDRDWLVVLDEANEQTKRDPRNRLFVALRLAPLTR